MVLALMILSAIGTARIPVHTQGLPITGVSVGRRMPAGVTHIETPPFVLLSHPRHATLLPMPAPIRPAATPTRSLRVKRMP